MTIRLGRSLRLVLFIANTALGVAATAQRPVLIKGRVLVPDHLIAPVHLTMEVGDTSCVPVKLKGGGRFHIDATDTQRYLMHFEQEGAISKIVQVDTRNADHKIGKRRTDIAFVVILDPVDSVANLRYAGPVGSITFHHSNGRMQVHRNRTMTDGAVSIWTP